jgi:hypothetical protein
MAVIHIPEEEAAKNLKSVLARAELGEDIAIDGSNSSFRLVPSTRRSPRSGTEILKMFADLPGERGIMDEDFARDVRSFREGHPESLDSSKWD